MARAGSLTLFLGPQLRAETMERARSFRVIPHDEALPAREHLRSLLLRGGALFLGYRADDADFAQRFEQITEVWGGRLPRAWVASEPGRIPDVIWQKWVWRGLWLFTATADEVLEGLE